jgi:hypothetical protein
VLKPVCSTSTTIVRYLTDHFKFPLPFDWGHCKRAIRTMGVRSIRVDLSRWLIAHIVLRIRELYGLDEDTTLDDAIQHGSECQATYEEFQEISGMFKFLRAVQAIAEERQTIADFFVCAARGPHVSDMRIESGVQCDIESQLDPGDMGTDTAHTTLKKYSLTHDYEVCNFTLNLSKHAYFVDSD